MPSRSWVARTVGSRGSSHGFTILSTCGEQGQALGYLKGMVLEHHSSRSLRTLGQMVIFGVPYCEAVSPWQHPI